METSSNETIKQAVMAGMGLAFISQHTLGVELATHQLTTLRVQTLPVMRQWNLVHRREKRLSPAAAAFKAFMLETGPPFLEQWSEPDGVRCRYTRSTNVQDPGDLRQAGHRTP